MTNAPTTGLDSSPAQPTTTPEDADHAGHRRWWIAGVVVLVAIVALILIFVIFKSPSYQVAQKSILVTPSGTAEVTFFVKNTGSATGTPKCAVHFVLPNGAGSGSRTELENHSIPANHASLFINVFPLSHNAATSSIADQKLKSSDVTIACH